MINSALEAATPFEQILNGLIERQGINAQGKHRLAEMVPEHPKARVRIEAQMDISVPESRLVQHQRGGPRF